MTTDLSKLHDQASDARLKTLLSYLATDPDNELLALDVADQALGAREPAIVATLFERELATLSDAQLDRLGHAQLQMDDAEAATRSFQALVDRGIDHPAVIVGLASARAEGGDTAGALALLSDEVVEADPRAARAKVALLQDSERFHDAREIAVRAIAAHPEDVPLHAAVSVLALDIEDRELALTAARQAGDHPDALTTLATLALEDQDLAGAAGLFDRVLARHEDAPRALLGRGLGKLMGGEAASAATDLDRAASLFDDHADSWTAAGWAYLLAGDLQAARGRFERASASALDNDPEAEAALAISDALDGRVSDAKQRIATLRQAGAESDMVVAAEALIDAAAGNPAAASALLERMIPGALPSLARRALH